MPARAAENDVTSFYQPPSTLPAGNGVIVKSAPMAYYTDISRWGRLPGTTTRILYTSTDHAGARTVVSGVVIVPTSSYSGARPIVGFAPGTHGMADRCAPSRQADSGTDYEASTVKSFLSAGFAVALTDYQGPGSYTHLDVYKRQGLGSSSKPSSEPSASSSSMVSLHRSMHSSQI